MNNLYFMTNMGLLCFFYLKSHFFAVFFVFSIKIFNFVEELLFIMSNHV